MKSSGTKGNIRKFPSHKILPFYLLILFFTLLYAAVDLITGKELAANEIIMSLTFGGTIIVNGWYLQVQLLYYVLFYCVIRFVKEKNTIIIMTALHVLYIFICASVGLSSLFYERTFIFVLGMIWAEYQHKIDFWLKDPKKYILSLVGSFILLAACYCTSSFLYPVLFRGMSYFFFVYAVMLLLKKVPIQCSITRFFGDISLEIYIMQGVFLRLFHEGAFAIGNPYLYVVAVSVCTILFATACHPLVKAVYRSVRKQKEIKV